MSTIVYRNGEMVSDSRAWSGSPVQAGQKAKITRLEDGTLVGCTSTNVGVPNAFIDWIERGARQDDRPNMPSEFGLTGLVVRPDGSAFLYTGEMLPSGPLKADFFAIGSGEEYALGALQMGASAQEAVRVACVLDIYSEQPLHTRTHEEMQVSSYKAC